jgi:hypothetical protein
MSVLPPGQEIAGQKWDVYGIMVQPKRRWVRVGLYPHHIYRNMKAYLLTTLREIKQQASEMEQPEFKKVLVEKLQDTISTLEGEDKSKAKGKELAKKMLTDTLAVVKELKFDEIDVVLGSKSFGGFLKTCALIVVKNSATDRTEDYLARRRKVLPTIERFAIACDVVTVLPGNFLQLPKPKTLLRRRSVVDVIYIVHPVGSSSVDTMTLSNAYSLLGEINVTMLEAYRAMVSAVEQSRALKQQLKYVESRNKRLEGAIASLKTSYKSLLSKYDVSIPLGKEEVLRKERVVRTKASWFELLLATVFGMLVSAVLFRAPAVTTISVTPVDISLLLAVVIASAILGFTLYIVFYKPKVSK